MYTITKDNIDELYNYLVRKIKGEGLQHEKSI